MELQTHLINSLVLRALQNSESKTEMDKFTVLHGKILTTKSNMVTLSADEVETLLEALLQEMQNYTSVTRINLTEETAQPSAAA